MKRENFYILLELPFDPPTEDIARIKAAIHSKHQEWSRMQSSEQLQSVALRYIEMVAEIEEVMFDPTKRTAEAKEAKEIHEGMVSSFEAELRVLEGKGYILPREVKELFSKYRSYGFNIEAIHKLAKAPITDIPIKNHINPYSIKALDQYKVRLIRAHLEILGEENLYTFLKRPQTSDNKDLLNVARAVHHNAFHSPEKTGINAARQLLADLCIEVFESEKSKASYDLFLTVNQFPKLNDLVEEEYERAGFISPEVLMRLVNYGTTTYGVPVLELEEYIRNYCNAYNIIINISSPNIICPNCHHTSEKGTTYCPECAAPLEGYCPQCNAFFTDGASICSQCGFSIGEMGKAIPYIAEAKQALLENNWGVSKHCISYIEKYWPTNKELDTLNIQLASVEEKYTKLVGSIGIAVAEGRYYAAKHLIKKAQENNIVVPEETVKLVDETLSDFEAQLKILKNREKIGYDNLHKLSSNVSDSLELNRLLSQYPPEPPSRFTARAIGESVHLSWDKSPSNGIVKYIVVRKKDSVPLTAYDGAIIYEGDENTFKDDTIAPLQSFFYSVFAKRGTSFSEMGTVSAAPIRIVPELKNLIITPADGAAQLTWEPPDNLKKVKIWRKKGEGKPVAAGEGEALDTSRLDGFTDTDLENGQLYWYYIVAIFQTADGETIKSRGISESVTPHLAITPIDQFTITPADEPDYYFINWEGPPNEDVMFMSSRTSPNYPVGKMLPVEVLLNNYHRLALDTQDSNRARFSIKITGGVYILPVVISGKFASIGRAEYLTNVPDVENVSHDIIDTDLFINFKWPSGQLMSTTVAWRKDTYPTSIGQKGTSSIVTSREQYDYDAGVRIPDINIGVYYLKIYAAFLSPEGKLIYSSGVNLLVDNTPAREFFYTIKYSKQLFSSDYKAIVTLEADQIFHMPKALIVGKIGSIPLSIADGEPLFEIDNDQEVAGSVIFEYRCGKLPKGMYARLFFYDDSTYTKLRPLPGKSLLLTKQ